jgi:hypothetical protein
VLDHESCADVLCLQGMASTAVDVQTVWAPSDAEKILRHILDFMRRNGGGSDGEGAVRAAKKHLEVMEVSSSEPGPLRNSLVSFVRSSFDGRLVRASEMRSFRAGRISTLTSVSNFDFLCKPALLQSLSLLEPLQKF